MSEKMTGYPSIDKPWLKYYGDEARRLEVPNKTAYEYMWENNKNNEKDVALRFYWKKISYKALFEKIKIVANAFVELGIKRNDVVAICAVTTPETIYAFYALNYIGATANIIDPRTNIDRIIDYLRKSNTKCIVAIDKCEVIVDKVLCENVCESAVIFSPTNTLNPLNKVNVSGYHKNDNKFEWNQFIKFGKERKAEKAIYEKERTAAIVYTGGTTGIPKGAMLSDDTFNVMAFQYMHIGIDYNREDNFLNIMPPFIAYGIVCGIHMTLTLGLTNVIIPLLDTTKLDKLVLKYRPMLMLCVPTHYEILAHSSKIEGKDLSFLKIPGCGGDGINVKLEQQLNHFLTEHNCPSDIAKGYGMTEVGSAAVTCRGKINKEGSVGIPHCKTIVSVFDIETMQELKYGEEGEICICTEAMMNSYLGMPEETQKVIKVHADGSKWVHSGDLGYMDEDGFLFIKGRMKRMIIRPDGHNVFPLQIENVIMEHDDIENCAVVGKSDTSVENGKWPVAYIVKKQNVIKDNNILLEEVQKLCADKLPPRDSATEFYIIDELPVTNLGKIDFVKLEQMD